MRFGHARASSLALPGVRTQSLAFGTSVRCIKWSHMKRISMGMFVAWLQKKCVCTYVWVYVNNVRLRKCSCARACELTGVNIAIRVFCPAMCFFDRLCFFFCLVFDFCVCFGIFFLSFLFTDRDDSGFGRPNKENKVVWRLNFLTTLIFLI